MAPDELSTLDRRSRRWGAASRRHRGTSETLCRYEGLRPGSKKMYFSLHLAGAAGTYLVVGAKPLFAPRAQITGYLGRYTRRLVLSNGGVVSAEGGHVTFSHKDRPDGDRFRTRT